MIRYWLDFVSFVYFGDEVEGLGGIFEFWVGVLESKIQGQVDCVVCGGVWSKIFVELWLVGFCLWCFLVFLGFMSVVL